MRRWMLMTILMLTAWLVVSPARATQSLAHPCCDSPCEQDVAMPCAVSGCLLCVDRALASPTVLTVFLSVAHGRPVSRDPSIWPPPADAIWKPPR